MTGTPDAGPNAEARVKAAADDLMTALRKAMRHAREQRDWSQEDAARHAGMNQSQWSRIEQGGFEPRLQVLLGIQLALGVTSLEKLFGPDTPTRTGKALRMDDPGA